MPINAGQIRAIFFDAVGTLIYPDPAAPAVYAGVGRRFGSQYTCDVISARFRTAFAREEAVDRAAGWRTDEERELTRWRNIVASVLDDVRDPEACFQELYRHFGRPEAWQLDPAAAALLEELQARGFLLGLASNYDHRLRLVAAGFPGLRNLRKIVISSEIGWRKPAPEFFQALCRRADAPPEQVFHVGDDPANDYEGAVAAGLQAMLLDREGKYASSAHRLDALTDIQQLLAAKGKRRS